MKWLLAVFALCALLDGEAAAFRGPLDLNDEFPYVVRIDYDGGQCSGVVLTRRLVLTAAHCLWTEKQWTKDIRISFTDRSGRSQTVAARKWWVTAEYQRTDEVAKLIDTNNAAAKDLMSSAQQSQTLNRAASEDLGVIISEDPIDLPSYAATILDDEYGFNPILRPLKTLSWTSDLFEDVREKLLKDGFFSNDVEALGVGFGNTYCDWIDDNWKNCEGAGRRRWGKVDLGQNWQEEVGKGKHAFLMTTYKGQTRESEGVSAFLPGDSGGALFVRRGKDSRWILVGILSRSSISESNQTSLLHQDGLIFRVMDSSDYSAAMDEVGAIAVASAAYNGRVSVGYSGYASTMQKAEQAALNACRQNGVPGCRIVDRKRNGCLFITWGENSGGTWWQVGYSARQAYDTCTKKGYSCARPIGGCLN